MHFWGMHLIWWLFWIGFIVLFLALIEPIPRKRARVLRMRRETPLDMLQRRYAGGELTTDQYEERRVALERDADVALREP